MSRFIKVDELANAIFDSAFKTNYDNKNGVRYEDIGIRGIDVLHAIDECKQYEIEPKKRR